MKLTRRQQEYFTNQMDLSHELDGLIYSSFLPERLGDEFYTAYDVLCLLKEKELVCIE
jgi:hypothetical protein